jgi:hypothetical protein
VFENKLAGGIFGSKREDVIGGWRKLDNEKLHNLCSSPNVSVIKSRKMRWTGHGTCLGREKKYIRNFNRITRREKPLVRSRRIWEFNVNLFLKKWSLVGYYLTNRCRI